VAKQIQSGKDPTTAAAFLRRNFVALEHMGKSVIDMSDDVSIYRYLENVVLGNSIQRQPILRLAVEIFTKILELFTIYRCDWGEIVHGSLLYVG
jgi:hypothetical protein